MVEHIGIEDARKNLGPLVSRVQHGRAEIILTRNGKPAARIVPIPQESTVPSIIRLVSANPGDVIDGVEIGDPESPIEFQELPQAAKDWATEQGYGPDAENELIYVLSEDAETPAGFPVFVVNPTPHQQHRTARVTQWATLRKTVDEVIGDYMNAGPATLTEHAWYVACWGKSGAQPTPALREDLAQRMRSIIDLAAIELAAETGRQYDDPEVLAEVNLDEAWTQANMEHVRAWAAGELTRWSDYNLANPENPVETDQFMTVLAALPH